MTQAKDWSAAVDASLNSDKGDLRATALATEGRNPDEFARARAVAQRHDWPVDAVADDPADFHTEDRLRRLDQLASEQPKAAEFLRQPEHMTLAGDDFDGMGLLARSIENLLPFGDRARKAVSRFALAPLRGLRRARLAESASVGTLSSLAATATTALDLADATNPNRVLGDLADMAAKHGDTAAATALRARVDPLGIGAARDTTTAIANDAADESARLGAEVGGLPTGADWLRDPAAALQQATAHLGQGAALSAPLMAVGLATRDPALGAAALAVPTGGQTYVDMRRQGVDRIHSLVAGAGTAALEYTGEELAFESILLPSWRKALFAAPATEYGQEFVTQLGQEAVENITTGQALDPWAMLQHANDAGLTGAFTGVAAAGGRAVVAAPLEYRARRRAAETAGVLGRIDASANAALRLSELTDAAAKLRLGERAPDVAEAFVAHMGAGEEHVYIPAAEFRTLFQDGSASALADELTGQSNALALAGETGDLVIPLARYVSTVARLPNAPEISRVARMDADGYSRADLEGLDIAAELGALGEAGAPDAAASDGVEEIKQGVLAGLSATGRYKDADAELMASLFARMVGTMAARTGQDPRALYDRYRLRINGQAAGEFAAQEAAPPPEAPAGAALRARWTGNFDATWAEYAALGGAFDSAGGRILNTDLARELSPEYRANRGLSADVHEAASEFVKEAYRRKLAAPTPPGLSNTVLLLAGGTGAGKTTGLDGLDEPFEIIYDTNANGLDSTVGKIEAALAAGRRVKVAYTFRDPVDALVNGALPRARRMAEAEGSGRTVPLAEHAATHLGAARTIRAIAERYAGNPDVDFRLIDNSHGKGNARVVPLESLPHPEENGLDESLRGALEAAFQAGNIDEAIYRGFANPGGGATHLRQLGGEAGRQHQSAGNDTLTPNPAERGVFVGGLFEQPAFHGTPHTVDRFTLHKIGTGEGAQAFGWGLYFTSRKEIADHYRHELSARKASDAGDHVSVLVNVALKAANGDRAKAVEIARSRDNGSGRDAEVIRRLEAGDTGGGNVYRVEVPDNSDLLDWDKPLSAQPEKVRKVLQSIIDGSPALARSVNLGAPGTGGEYTGGQLYEDMRNLGVVKSVREASQLLSAAGIPGLRYLDGSSRDDGEGSHNYVVWDENAISTPEQVLSQGGGAAPRGQLQIGADRSMSITLFEGADLSTFMHESGHFWLEVMTDLAADPNAPQQVRDDFAAVRAYLGADGQSFTTDQHERWARSFEAYLREGKAPAPELVGAFARFRRWLTDLYRALAQLNVTLTPEITGVMDRMIAVDEEIELVRGQQSMVPIVEPGHAAALGLTDRQWETYAGMLEAAVEEARAEVTSKVLRAERQEHEQAWREEARTVRADIVAALERSPSYRAWRALTGRDETLPGLTLDRDALAARYTPEEMKGLRSLNAYRVEGGVDPDVAASLLGFDSGDALVQGLLTIRPAQAAISAEVEAEMHRRHPDPIDDGSLPDLVTRALYRSRRVAVLEHELGLLAKVAGQPVPNVRQLRAIADAVIARKTARTLRPRDYLVAERKAAREATKAAAAGDFAAALTRKREQALQATLYGRARAAQERAEREVTALRRAASPATRERIGKAGKDYVEALDAMLEGHELRTVSGREVRRREALRAWVAAMQADNDETAVSDALLARVESEQVVNVADLPLPALTDLHDAVKNLLHLARLKNTLVANDESRRWEDARADLLGRARQTLAEGKPLPFSEADRTRWQRLGDLYGDFMDWTLQPETVVEWLDGGEAGPWHDYLWTQSERAQAERERLRRMVGDALAAATAEHPNPKALDRRVLIRSLGRSVSRHTILAAALNLGNVSNTDKLMRGGFSVDGVQVPIDQAAIGEMLGHLTADDARLIQRVWDAVELLWPEIVKQQEALTGLAPPKVEARPLVIAGVALRGGYYPLVYDPRASSAGVKQAQSQEDKLFAGGGFTKAVTSKGHTVERTEYAAPILLDYHTVLTRHIGDVITDLSHRRFVKQALKVLGDNEIKGVIHQRLTSGAYHALLGSVRNAVVGGHRISEPASRGFEKIKRETMTNTAVAALGFKVALTIGNMIGAPVQAAARVHARYLVAGFTRYMAHPLQMTQVIHELSPMMIGRAEGHDTSYEQVISQLRGKHGIRYKIAVVALACHRLIVPLIERPVWMGRYMQALAAKETPGEAARLADKAIRQTQTKNAPKDLSAVERDPRYTLFNMFIGPLIVINNRMQDAGLRGRLHGHVETPAEALGTWIAMIAGGSLLFEWANGRGPDDDDDDGLGFADWAKWIALKAALLPLQTIPMIRNAANLFDGFSSARPDPVTDAMASLVKFGKAAYESVDSYLEGGDVDAEKLTKTTARAAGVVVGVPSAQALTTGEFLYDVGTGEYTPQSPADARYLIYRRDK